MAASMARSPLSAKHLRELFWILSRLLTEGLQCTVVRSLLPGFRLPSLHTCGLSVGVLGFQAPIRFLTPSC